jgi:hypothetical protein
MSQKRADYQRAMGACLDGRGYAFFYIFKPYRILNSTYPNAI